MVGAKNWPFAKARFEAARRGMRINELYGAKVATANIDNDIGALLASFKFVSIINQFLKRNALVKCHVLVISIPHSMCIVCFYVLNVSRQHVPPTLEQYTGCLVDSGR